VGRRHLVMLVLLSAIWGASFMFIKVAVREIDPLTTVLGRVALGAIALGVLLPLQMPAGEAIRQLREHAFPITIAGLLNSTIPFWLLFWAETRIDSGLAAILQASAPLFTALLALGFARSERVTGIRLAGFLLGFAGVALLVGAVPRGSILAGVAVIGTALCYSIAALYAGRRLEQVPPLVLSFGTLVAATLVALGPGLAKLPSSTPGWKAIGSVVALGVAGSAVAYILYYAIIAGAGASRAILVTYLVPPMALVWGATLLGESVTASDLGGLAMILAGVALGTRAVRGRREAKGVPA
jgi:drug/metabolite transporter (DMT)-like permease